jgi:hypothetical protein
MDRRKKTHAKWEMIPARIEPYRTFRVPAR